MTSGWDVAGWMIAAGLVIMADESANGCAVLRAWGNSRYVGGAEEAHAECIGAFWWRLGWVEECVDTCNESRHGSCYVVVCSVERFLYYGVIKDFKDMRLRRSQRIYQLYLVLPAIYFSRDLKPEFGCVREDCTIDSIPSCFVLW